MVDQKLDKDVKTPNSKLEHQSKKAPPCLYLCLSDGDKSPTNVAKNVEQLGFKVEKISDVGTAANVCESKRMALIILEDCKDKAFIKGIKSPNACNEHTPIVFISSVPLSDAVRDLMQEPYIDELVFKCLTLECDLASAVKRLMMEPGQFAVTPKQKKPCTTRKRKLETAFPSLNGKDIQNGDCLSGTVPSESAGNSSYCQGIHHGPRDVPMLSAPFLQRFDQNCAMHVNHFMNSMPHMQQLPAAYYELPSSSEACGSFQHFPGMSAMFSSISPSGPIPYPCVDAYIQPHTEALTKKKEDCEIQDMDKVQSLPVTNTQLTSAWQQQQQRPLVIMKAEENTEQGSRVERRAEDSPKNVEQGSNVYGTDATAEECENGKEAPGKVSADHSAQKSSQDMYSPGLPTKGEENAGDENADKGAAERRSCVDQECVTKKQTGSIVVITNMPSSERRSRRKSGSLNAAERKEHHLDKEKKRRERVTRSWHWLRRLAPNCESYADKATVFEMTVAYLHHCWKYHGQLLQQINKDFATLCQSNLPPEDMEEMVSCLLEKERNAFENFGRSSSNTGD